MTSPPRRISSASSHGSAEQQAEDPRRFAPAVARNRDVLRRALLELLPPQGKVLEVASGTGEHAAYIAPDLPGTVIWQSSDADPSALPGIDAHARTKRSGRLPPAIGLDVEAEAWEVGLEACAVFCANMVHIAPWTASLGLLRGAARMLQADGPLILYGPFRRDGLHISESNETFDRALKERNPLWGVRDVESELVPAADLYGFGVDEIRPMPANNSIIVFRKTG